jgi:2-phosphoglycerate kinase
MTDRLTLTRALESGGMASEAAERIATEIYQAIHDNVASKADIAAIRADIAAIRGETRAEFAAVRGEMREMEQRIVIRLGGMIVIGTGVLIAIKFFG